MMTIKKLNMNEVMYIKYNYNPNISGYARYVPQGICSEVTHALMGDEEHSVHITENKDILIYRIGYDYPAFISINNGASFLALIWAETDYYIHTEHNKVHYYHSPKYAIEQYKKLGGFLQVYAHDPNEIEE